VFRFHQNAFTMSGVIHNYTLHSVVNAVHRLQVDAYLCHAVLPFSRCSMLHSIASCKAYGIVMVVRMCCDFDRPTHRNQ
jgi:hypothetical protein